MAGYSNHTEYWVVNNVVIEISGLFPFNFYTTPPDKAANSTAWLEASNLHNQRFLFLGGFGASTGK